jgi:ATP-dependent DNA helicase DinG
LFYHPKGLPQPNSPDFVAEIVKVAIPVINTSKGRTFFLFTSHRALQQAAKILDKQIKYPLLVLSVDIEVPVRKYRSQPFVGWP